MRLGLRRIYSTLLSTRPVIPKFRASPES